MNDIHEMVTAINGASSGIGKACALEFANRGTTIVPAVRNETALLGFENGIDAAIALKTDIADSMLCEL